jgi:hypothetical protein
MKNLLGLALVTALLSGCVVIPTGKSKDNNPASLIKGDSNVDNSKNDITRVNTRGQLTCNTNEVCPELDIDWNKNQGQYNVSFHLYDRQQYDLKEFTFIVDGKTRSFSTIGATTTRNINNSGIYESTNNAEVPSNLFSQINQAKNIQVVISTNQGDITRDMLSPNKQSDAFRLFRRAY